MAVTLGRRRIRARRLLALHAHGFRVPFCFFWGFAKKVQPGEHCDEWCLGSSVEKSEDNRVQEERMLSVVCLP